ncbi:hypothetical protein E2562_033875 [Oryza meyeriana var. granulata]|uniref:Uncharacterized protein n=1 Tax=Oryza meyeriana var. granulata TaxID=110450 RepID=A0A6G1BQ60_9ORYZ|nr:hypothetical protein E2562_033875 [Oryza meyeriana var. granulata]
MMVRDDIANTKLPMILSTGTRSRTRWRNQHCCRQAGCLAGSLMPSTRTPSMLALPAEARETWNLGEV